jgi:hypothetical protein
MKKENMDYGMEQIKDLGPRFQSHSNTHAGCAASIWTGMPAWGFLPSRMRVDGTAVARSASTSLGRPGARRASPTGILEPNNMAIREVVLELWRVVKSRLLYFGVAWLSLMSRSFDFTRFGTCGQYVPGRFRLCAITLIPLVKNTAWISSPNSR